MRLHSFLKFLGFEPIFEKDVKVWQMITNWIYPFSIWLLLWYHPILVTVICFKKDRLNILPGALFLFIQPIQYHIAFWYFRSQKQKRLYESTNLEFLRNDEKDNMSRYLPTESMLLKMIITSSFLFVLLSLVIFILIVFDTDSYYRDIPFGVQILGYIIIPLSLIYGKTVLTLNTFIFVFSFFQQIHKMKELSEKLNKKRWTEGHNLSVATLCYEIFDIRYTLSRMINKLGDMYTYTTILGSTAVGLVLSSGGLNYQIVTSGSMFLIMQIFFLFIIQSIGMERENFKDIIKNRKFASAYILRRNEFCQACIQVQADSNEKELFDDLDADIQNLIQVTPEPSGMLQPLPRLNGRKDVDVLTKDIKKILEGEQVNEIRVDDEDKKSSDDVHVVEIEEENIPREKTHYNKKSFGGLGPGIADSAVISTESPEDTLDESEDIRHHIQKLLEGEIGDPHVLADSGCRLTTEEFIRCIYEWVTNTGSTIDWIVLNSILNDDWSSFGMFGIEFSDGSALRKAIYASVILVGSGSIIGLIEGLEW